MPLKVPSALCCMNETVKYRRGGAFLEREKRRERELNENQLEGRNAVLEVLRSGRDIEKIMVQKGNVEGTIKRIVAQAAEKGVVIQEVSRQKLDELSQTKNHQGVIALVSAHDYVEVEDILAAARAKGEDPFIILLDGITDPHNLGAILCRRAWCDYPEASLRRAECNSRKNLRRCDRIYACGKGDESRENHGAAQEGGSLVCLRGYGRK